MLDSAADLPALLLRASSTVKERIEAEVNVTIPPENVAKVNLRIQLRCRSRTKHVLEEFDESLFGFGYGGVSLKQFRL